MKHKFTSEECKKGGWTRARQHAIYRRSNPSPAEAATRQIVLDLGWDIQLEYEIQAEFYPQWIDILATKGERKVAIEVDGSHGWHGYDGKDSKMGKYDESKARWCIANDIELILVINSRKIKEILQEKLK